MDSVEAWQAWLGFATSFHRYSFNNTVLIWTQRPDATLVAGYRAWQAKGRQVRRGEAAIRVLGPVTVRDRKVDERGRPVVDATGKAVVQVRVVGVKSMSVFDVCNVVVRFPQTVTTSPVPPGHWRLGTPTLESPLLDCSASSISLTESVHGTALL